MTTQSMMKKFNISTAYSVNPLQHSIYALHLAYE